MIGSDIKQVPFFENYGYNVSDISREVGVKIPTIISSRLWHEAIDPDNLLNEIEIKRKLWDLLEMLLTQLQTYQLSDVTLPFEFSYVGFIPTPDQTIKAVKIKSIISKDVNGKPKLNLLQSNEELK